MFFDSFDEQYVGTPEVSLYRWLVNTLFPWLAGVMHVSLVIAGRERLEISQENKFKTEVAKLLKRVELNRFDKEQVRAYFEKYFDDKNLLDLQKPYPRLPSEKDGIWEKITELTDGKPIFIDFVCDLAKRDFEIEERTLPQSLERMIAKSDNSEPLSVRQKSFKTYLINRLHLRDPRKAKGNLDKKDRDIYFRAEVIRILSVAKHGLTPESYQWVRDDGFADKQKAKEVEDYFTNTFTDTFTDKGKKSESDKKREGLPYVKNRGETRLLHDEILELLQEYHWDQVDPERVEYNKRLRQITRLYEEQLLPIKGSARYSRLLEYIEYLFSFRGRVEETAAVNRYLYEFSRHLDNFPDLCARLNAKARRFYFYKKADFDKRVKDAKSVSPADNSLSFDRDFPLLAKIPMRTVEYLLTERTNASNDWSKFVGQYLDELREYIVRSQQIVFRTYGHRQALEARLLSAEGEMLLWKNEWEKGEAKIREAKKLFYLTGDSHAVDWCEHLLGFELQRCANFTGALQRHQDTIESAILSLSNLCDEPGTAPGHPEHYVNHYRIRLLIKVLSRAGGNTAVNHRYRGRVVDGIKTLQSFYIMAQLIGSREVLRININRKQLNSLLWQKQDFGSEKEYVAHSNDVLMQRRLSLIELIHDLRQIGGEDQYYRQTYQDFEWEKPMSESGDRAERVKDILKEFLKGFSPVPLPLTYPKPPRIAITQFYEEVKEHLPATRENADLYFQFGGRAILSTKYNPDEQQPYYDVARIAYENALAVARKAGFEYLVLQSLESLCRLHYLVGNAGELDKSIREFDKKMADLKDRGYTPYYDLLSKYWLTRGDHAFQVLDGQNLLPDGTPIVVEAYVKMLLFAVQHNQHLYHLILEIFASRLKLLFSRMLDSEVMPFKRAILRTVEASDLINKDKRFLNYIGWLLQAVTLHLEPEEIAKDSLFAIQKGIRRLMQRGEFIKAGTVNEFLIEYFKNKDKKAFAHRLYQQVYIYQGANKHNKVKELLNQMFELSKECSREKDPLHPAHITHDIAMAVQLYHTPDIWNLEQFILGELGCFRKQKKKGKQDKELFEKSRKLLEYTIGTMSGHLTSLDRPDKKLF
ncbi:MAG TPA: hypothetical protein PK228_05565, partial [Saprospiraceae bacterium]|nr:hypothetical protein [Saprospiraceae bacterium]